MKDIKKFLKKLDLFGVNLNFKYQANDTYTTSLGGLFILIFGLVALSFGIYNFIPFIKRKNLSIIYYTMNIAKTEEIKFKDSKALFNIGFHCEEKGGFRVRNIFNLDSKFVIYTKDLNGNSNKTKEELSWHYCTYEDFYNKYNDSFNYLGLAQFQCLDDYDRTIEGIYSDKIFSYYEFTLRSKNKTKENYEQIYEYLSKSDCKLEIYYTDITIDLENYKEPIKPFINSIFIQLNPTLNIKRNIYFMNQYLYDDDSLIAVFVEEGEPNQIETLFSRYEEYALFKGSKFDENNTEYAKIFLRADTKKTIIKRTYQKFTEFYADVSALLIALYEILIIIFSYINNFYAEESVTKKLFFFKELGIKHFNNLKKYKKLSELNKINGISSGIAYFETIQNDLNIKKFNNYFKKRKNKFQKDKIQNNKLLLIEKSKSRNSSIIKEFEDSAYSENDEKIYKNNANTIDINKLNKDIKSQCNNSKSILNKGKNTNNSEKNQQNINYTFNVFEIFLVTFCYKCIKGKLKLKNELSSKAKELLYSKLDIHIYLRNMFLFDIINQTIIDGRIKNIINLLSRPVISINNKENEEEEIFYQNYNKKEFNKFYEGLIELIEKNNKEKKEEKLILLANKRLKEFL